MALPRARRTIAADVRRVALAEIGDDLVAERVELGAEGVDLLAGEVHSWCVLQSMGVGSELERRGRCGRG